MVPRQNWNKHNAALHHADDGDMMMMFGRDESNSYPLSKSPDEYCDDMIVVSPRLSRSGSDQQHHFWMRPKDEPAAMKSGGGGKDGSPLFSSKVLGGSTARTDSNDSLTKVLVLETPQPSALSLFRRRVGSRTTPATPAHAPTAANKQVPWMEDDRFTKSKVYQGRLDRAATLIQAHFRRYRLRNYLAKKLKAARKAAKKAAYRTAVVKVQAAMRAKLVRLYLQESVAAILIQAQFRGYAARFKYKIHRLTEYLLDIQTHHAQELAEICAWKQEQKELIQQELLQEQLHQEEELRIQLETLQTLERENRKLRAKNDKYKLKCEQMQQENLLIQQAMDQEMYTEGIKIHEYIQYMTQELVNIKATLEQLQIQEQVLTDAIERRKHLVHFEQNVCGILEEAIVEVTERIRLSPQCERGLVNYIWNVSYGCSLA